MARKSRPSGRIFISYRRADTPHIAGRLFDRLASRFGKRNIFMDVDSIEPGLDFSTVIEKAVSSCDVLLALVGQRWLDSRETPGPPRIQEPGDLVALEIATALKKGVRVIPVLVDNAPPPPSGLLPDELVQLARLQAVRVEHITFATDVNMLVAAIGRALIAIREERSHAAKTPVPRPDPPRRGSATVVTSAGLRRSIGLVSLTSISLGSIIGSGWLLISLTAAKAAGPASTVSWLFASLIIVLLALVHAELGATYPLSGGTARVTRLAFGSLAGFGAAWVAWLQAVWTVPDLVDTRS